MPAVLSFLRLPATPFILLLAILLGLSLAVVTFLVTGVRGSLHYMAIPVVQGVLDPGGGPAETVFDWAELREEIVVDPQRADVLPPLDPPGSLLEPGPFGRLPVVAESGQTAWRTYRNQSPVAEDVPKIGLVLTELGLLEDLTRQAANLLPASVSLAYSSYANRLNLWLRHGRYRGHDVFLDLPVASADPAVDRGPLAVGKTSATPTALERLLGAASGYVGVAMDAGVFGLEPSNFGRIAEELGGRGVALVELGTSRLAAIARSQHVPYLAVETAIDDVLDRDAIEQSLGLLEGMALEQGQALAYFRPFPISLDVVWQWSQTLEQKGLALVPIGHFLEASVATSE